MSKTKRERPKGVRPAGAKKKPAPKWMREKFDMGSQRSHSDAMNEGMRRAAARGD